jgi:hypothetical protein
MPLTTIDEVVNAGIAAQVLIDKHLAKAYDAAVELTAVTEAGVMLGMVQSIEAKTIIGDARAAQGSIGAVAAEFARLHRAQTDACIAAGADLGSVTTAGGVTIGGVGPLSGGR